MIEAMMAIPPVTGGGDTPVDGNHDMLFHFNSDFTDSHGTALSKFGTASISSAQAKFGGSSALWNATSYLQFSTPFAITGDFTVDFWGYETSRNNYPCVMYDSAKNIQLHLDTTSAGMIGGYWSGPRPISSGNLWNLNIWTHFAFVRSGTYFKCFVNGTKYLDYNLGRVVSIGFNNIFGPNGFGFYGYVDEFAVKRTAKWTDNFTPPTGPYTS